MKNSTTVSSAAANTRVISATKTVMKLVVAGVRIAGEKRKVKFIARNGMVVCRSMGMPKFVVREREVGGFIASCRATKESVTAPTPEQAFARGVKGFWAAA